MRKGIVGVLAAGVLAGCSDDGPISNELEGRFLLTWEITIEGSAGTCAEVGAESVEVTAEHAGTGDVFVETFPCEDLGRTTEPIPTGNYSVEIRLLDAGDVQLNSVDIVLPSQIQDGEITELGNFEFAFSGGGA